MCLCRCRMLSTSVLGRYLMSPSTITTPSMFLCTLTLRHQSDAILTSWCTACWQPHLVSHSPCVVCVLLELVPDGSGDDSGCGCDNELMMQMWCGLCVSIWVCRLSHCQVCSCVARSNSWCCEVVGSCKVQFSTSSQLHCVHTLRDRSRWASAR